jgi:flagellar export protein FliJ
MHVGESRLRTVIKVKQYQVKKAQKELAVIAVDREQEEHHLNFLEYSKSSAMTEAVRTMKARAVDLQTSRAYILSISRQVTQQASKVDDMKVKEDGKRAELLEKSQSEQMLEKLEQKRRAEVEKEQERKSQRMLDVLAQRMKS